MSATICPGCGRRVSAYAAGCADCGADLDEHRRRLQAVPGGRARRRRRAPSLPGGPVALSKGELLWTVGIIFFLPFVHLLAGLLAAIGADDRWHAGRQTAFTIFVLLGLVAAGLEIAALV